MEKMLIIDGNNLLFQMFYGMPNKIYNKNGETIHATIGFISYVLKQINLYDITKCCVVFDRDMNVKRKELCNEYKANRKENWDELSPDEIPFNEEEKIIKCLEYLNIKVLFSNNMEADDLIASIVKLFEKQCEIIISSFDSDFFQLINDNVKVLRYRGKSTQIYDKLYFEEKFGFKPSKYVLYKSLVGDTSDNIRGVKSIGPKRASLIIKNNETLEDIINSDIDIKYRELIKNNYKLIERNVCLIKLEYINNIVYEIEYFNFDRDKIKMKNSTILSICDIF